VTFENALNIFTDGSSLQSPRTGGFGIRFIKIDSFGNEQIQEPQFPGYKNATNNQMELYACVMALREALRLQLIIGVSKIVIYTDSRYIVDNYKKAMFEWPKTKWYTRSGRPVLNADLWKDLIRCMKKVRMKTEFIWVKGHSKNIHNIATDRMAKQSAKYPINKPLSIVHVRRKLTSETVNIGCVELHGQRISIRIITSEYLKVQKLSKYKYEVISKNSKYFGYVDIIFSNETLRVGHSFYVKFNCETFNPRIEKVYKEIIRK